MEHAPAPPDLLLTQPVTADRLRSKLRLSDVSLHGVTLAGALAIVVLLIAVVYKVVDLARPAISKYGLGFVTSTDWNPVVDKYGAWNYILGTLISSLGALLLAAPISIGIAIYLTELSPRGIRQPLAIMVELLAAIPSVVLGLWGILVLGPFIHGSLEVWLNDALGWIPLFSGTPSPVGLLPAIFVLALMMLPIITSISREVLLTAPRDMRDGALALGVTRWEMIRGIILPYAKPGIAAAMMLGLARALGEAIAVTQVIGSGDGYHGLYGTNDTLGSRVASQFQGAASSLQAASLAYLAVILLVIALLVNISARVIVATSRAKGVPLMQREIINANGGNPFGKGRDNMKRRRARSKTWEYVTLTATLIAVAMLVLIVGSVLLKGASALNWDFFTQNAAAYGATGGGIANAIVGTAVLVAIATAMAVPVGILVAVYLSEFARPVVATPLRIALDVFTGIPSIVIGIFVFALLVVGNGQSGWAGAFALALIMLPYIARGTDEVLGLTAKATREASLALGASRAYTVAHATLPTAVGGIVTSTVLAIARVAGETAPLLFASSIAANVVSGNPGHPLNSIPLTIFTYSESPSPDQHAQAWAAALTLIVFVLLISVVARVGSARYMRRIRG